MQYACLIYFDPKDVFGPNPEAAEMLRDLGPYDAELKAGGQHVSAVPLQFPNTAMTVTVRDGKMSATDGPFIETKEMLGGLLVVEARDLNDAVQIAARHPFARVGHIEVRPLVDFTKPRPRL